MGVPYSKIYKFEGVIGGVQNCLELPVPPRGILARLIVSQTDGTLSGYTYDLYDRKDACDGISQDSCDPGDELLAPVVHQLMATQTVAAAAADSALFQLHVPYVNQDSLCDGIRASTNDRLYLAVTPDFAGTGAFEVAVTIESEVI